MTQEQQDARNPRVEREMFVISQAQEGWRVRSVRTPSRYYLVTGNGEGLKCNCPDFENQFPQDPNWQCKHILAVTDYQQKSGTGHTDHCYDAAERAAIQGEVSEKEPQPRMEEPSAGHMQVKRSVSPDGHIDSMSVECSFPLEQQTPTQLKSRALKALKLQNEIAKEFLKDAKPNGNGAAAPKDNGAIFARVLDVGTSDGQRFYLNVSVNGKRARFFGTANEIAAVLAGLGEPLGAENIEAGLRVNLPCRVLTKLSADGRYLNVTKVLPANGHAGVRR